MFFLWEIFLGYLFFFWWGRIWFIMVIKAWHTIFSWISIWLTLRNYNSSSLSNMSCENYWLLIMLDKSSRSIKRPQLCIKGESSSRLLFSIQKHHSVSDFPSFLNPFLSYFTQGYSKWANLPCFDYFNRDSFTMNILYWHLSESSISIWSNQY